MMMLRVHRICGAAAFTSRHRPIPRTACSRVLIRKVA